MPTLRYFYCPDPDMQDMPDFEVEISMAEFLQREQAPLMRREATGRVARKEIDAYDQLVAEMIEERDAMGDSVEGLQEIIEEMTAEAAEKDAEIIRLKAEIYDLRNKTDEEIVDEVLDHIVGGQYVPDDPEGFADSKENPMKVFAMQIRKNRYANKRNRKIADNREHYSQICAKRM